MEGPHEHLPMRVRLPKEHDAEVSFRPVPKFRARQTNKAMKARRRAKYYDNAHKKGIKWMRNLRAHWNLAHLEYLRERLWH